MRIERLIAFVLLLLAPPLAATASAQPKPTVTLGHPIVAGGCTASVTVDAVVAHDEQAFVYIDRQDVDGVGELELPEGHSSQTLSVTFKAPARPGDTFRARVQVGRKKAKSYPVVVQDTGEPIIAKCQDRLPPPQAPREGPFSADVVVGYQYYSLDPSACQGKDVDASAANCSGKTVPHVVVGVETEIQLPGRWWAFGGIRYEAIAAEVCPSTGECLTSNQTVLTTLTKATSAEATGGFRFDLKRIKHDDFDLVWYLHSVVGFRLLAPTDEDPPLPVTLVHNFHTGSGLKNAGGTFDGTFFEVQTGYSGYFAPGSRHFRLLALGELDFPPGFLKRIKTFNSMRGFFRFDVDDGITSARGSSFRTSIGVKLSPSSLFVW